jgi:hypothetical protein
VEEFRYLGITLTNSVQEEITRTGTNGRMLGKELTENKKAPVFSNILAITWRRS